MPGSLTDLLNQSHRPRILVLGDLMLDRYLWGDVKRVSPEGPIPVLQVSKREDRLGGAGSVASMLSALDADVALVSVTGDDGEGRTVRRLLEECDVDVESIATAADRATTVKERLLGRTHGRQPQQMIRVDRENTASVEEPLARRLLDSVASPSRSSRPAVDQRLRQGRLREIGCWSKQSVWPRRRACRSWPIRSARPITLATAAARASRPIGSKRNKLWNERSVRPRRDSTPPRALLAFGVDSAAVTLDRDGIAWADVHGEADSGFRCGRARSTT